MNRLTQLLIAALACGVFLSACETSGSKKRDDERTIDRQGLRAIAILGGYLFPRGWEESMQVSVARRMFPLEYHGNEHSGQTLIQSKIEFDAGALQRLLTDVQRTTASFTSSTDAGHPFGKDSKNGAGNTAPALKWWKPGKHKNAKYYYWSTARPNEPTTRVWLQVTDEKRNVKLVYVRIESA